MVLKKMKASWDEQIENILLDGHAVVTTIEVTPDFQFYTEGVFMSDQCQNWHLGHYPQQSLSTPQRKKVLDCCVPRLPMV